MMNERKELKLKEELYNDLQKDSMANMFLRPDEYYELVFLNHQITQLKEFLNDEECDNQVEDHGDMVWEKMGELNECLEKKMQIDINIKNRALRHIDSIYNQLRRRGIILEEDEDKY